MKAVNRALPLLASEQVGPKGWINNISVFELAADYDATYISSMLLSAWKNFKQRTPMVGVEAVPADAGSKPAGMLKLQHYQEREITDFVIKDHRNDENMPSFVQLNEQGFPGAAMNDEKVCLRGLGGPWPNFGVDRLATNLMQVNLIKGGLLLNHLCFHAMGDGAGMWKLTELFAEDVRRAQGLPIEQPATVTVADREKLLHSTGKYDSAAFAAAHPEFVHLPFIPPGLPPALTGAKHHAHVFRFSPDAIKALKDECAPSNVRLLKNQASVTPLPGFISTNDALTALLWRSVQLAEHADPSSIAADKTSICQVSLADLAVMIRMAVNKCGKSYHDELAHYIENMDNVNCLAGSAFLDMPGANMLQSNWSEFDYYGIEWGSALGNHIKALRFPAGGVCAGFQIIMPSPANAPKGTAEVLVDTWNRYAKNPTNTRYD
ncbi:hypothetical protein AUEXF2481DRAFT_48784 [Aureobasidium subglaciale EXF-2481]|uniref:Trichothecene 3-O-acetyltransferase-like N-terminal domain-containing protein n=1 Tax=Aureobasidium subglaciale (strain EXF-2481) TaxID=1043005 RepID=A0A074Y334_AURSE|nr:uncharacterized protein AUEXF2481DRAFT_48784 [Aureobasidium subglaciale EXF-2481]KEQ90364.1 hypothetical protein AUEXF2481DRAFT_48784 [Aureobasidium subglaciale EXF-2481]